MSRNQQIRLVCFDLGGVLIRICRTWQEGCAAAGVDFRGSFPERFELLHGRDHLREQLQTGRIDRETYARNLSEAMGGQYSPQEIVRIHEAWILGEYPGAADIVERLNVAGIPTASLSNTDHAHWDFMTGRYPAFMHLRHRHASHLLNLQKPDAAIYREFEKRVGISAANILFFDDLLENVEAARREKWTAEQIDPLSSTSEQITAALHRHGVL